MEPAAQEASATPSAQKVKAFIAGIVKKAAREAGRADVVENVPAADVEAARRSYARLMGEDETPMAVFLDHKHRGRTKGMLISDRFIYSARVPAALPIDRVYEVHTEGGGFSPEVLVINGAVFLLHKTIDPLAVAVTTAIAGEIAARKVFGKLIRETDEKIALLTNEEYVKPATKALAMGTKPAEVQARLAERGLDETTAETLVTGLIAMTRPGSTATGMAMIFVGVVGCLMAIAVLIDPWTKILGLRAINPIAFVLAILGGVVVAGVGVGVIQSSRKRRKDTVWMGRAWKALFTRPPGKRSAG